MATAEPEPSTFIETTPLATSVRWLVAVSLSDELTLILTLPSIEGPNDDVEEEAAEGVVVETTETTAIAESEMEEDGEEGEGTF